jgi:hypothetical protein
VENFLVTTEISIDEIPLVMPDNPDKPFQVYRVITAAPTLTTIDKSHGVLFDKLKACIHREDVFLKGEDDDSHQYIDIQAILAQGIVVVSDELKQELGNFLK